MVPIWELELKIDYLEKQLLSFEEEKSFESPPNFRESPSADSAKNMENYAYKQKKKKDIFH